MTNFIDKIIEEFDKKVRELKNPDNAFSADGDTGTYDFGYRTVRGSEIFTVVDFGNIKSFIRQALAEPIQHPHTHCFNKMKKYQGHKIYEEFANVPLGKRADWLENLVKKALTQKCDEFEK